MRGNCVKSIFLNEMKPTLKARAYEQDFLSANAIYFNYGVKNFIIILDGVVFWRLGFKLGNAKIIFQRSPN